MMRAAQSEQMTVDWKGTSTLTTGDDDTVTGGGMLVIVASLFATVPVWLPTFPPMTDLPLHAAQVASLGAMLHGGVPGDSPFYINWFTPYLAGYLLVYAVSSVVPIVIACKIVIAAAIAALPIATALLMTETGTDRRFALLVIPAMYGFAFHWGLLNFLVAAPIGLVFLWLTLRQARRPSAGGAIGLAVAINALFFCHAMTCLFFGAIGTAIMVLRASTPVIAARRLLPLASVVPVMIAWGTRTIENPLARQPVDWDLNWLITSQGYYGFSAAWTTPGGFGWGRILGILPRLLGVVPGMLAAILGVTLFVIPWRAGARLTPRYELWAPIVVCLATLLFAPSTLFGIALTFQRFTLFVVPFLLIMLSPAPAGRRWPRWLWPACALVAAGWIAFVSANAIRFEKEAEGFPEIVARMEPGERVLSLIIDRDSTTAIAPVFLHFPSWYAALRGGIVDPSVAGTHVQLVLFRPGFESAARLSDGFEWHPAQFESGRFDVPPHRYFVVRTSRDPTTWVRRGAACPVHVVHQVNRWWLFESDRSCVGTAHAQTGG
jgi:hypothetical protein